MICLSNGSSFELQAAIVQERPIKGLFVGRFFPIFPICRTFLGDFTPDRLDSRSLETLWEWKNRVLLEEYYIFNAAIPLEVD